MIVFRWLVASDDDLIGAAFKGFLLVGVGGEGLGVEGKGASKPRVACRVIKKTSCSNKNKLLQQKNRGGASTKNRGVVSKENH